MKRTISSKKRVRDEEEGSGVDAPYHSETEALWVQTDVPLPWAHQHGQHTNGSFPHSCLRAGQATVIQELKRGEKHKYFFK